MIVKTWLEGEFEGGRHAVRVDQIMKIDEDRVLVMDEMKAGE